MRQQPPLAPDSACVPFHVTVAPNDAVARDDQGRRGSVRAPDPPRESPAGDV